MTEMCLYMTRFWHDNFLNAFLGNEYYLLNLGIIKKEGIMGTTVSNPPLTNVQVELLKLFSVDLPEEQLIELKRVMAKFLLDHARDRADEIWDEKGYSDEKLDNLLK